VKGRWHTAGRQLLSKKQLQLMRLRARLQPAPQRVPSRIQQQSWHAWFSSRYWQLSDKLERAASSSRVCQFFSSNFRIDPQRIALGVAEGTILYKSTVWFTVPLQLWLVMHIFRMRRSSAVLLDDEGARARKEQQQQQDKQHDQKQEQQQGQQQLQLQQLGQAE